MKSLKKVLHEQELRKSPGKIPLLPKKSMKKESSATFDYVCSEGIIIVKWNDTTALPVATNKVKYSV